MTASHNIVVIGGGGAGLRAAIAIAEMNPRLGVAIVSLPTGQGLLLKP